MFESFHLPFYFYLPCSHLFHPIGLFPGARAHTHTHTQVPNGRSRIGQNRECWVPRPSATRPLDLALFEFVGQLFGAAV